MSPRLLPALAFAILLNASPSLAQDTQRVRTDKVEVIVETVARNLDHPWGLTFLSDGRMLVTERPGRLRIVSGEGKLSEPIKGMPRIATKGQGGLLDVALDPAFQQNRLVYLSFAEDRGDGRAGTSVLRGRLDEAGTTLTDTQVIFRQEPSHTGGNHFGSRLVFDRNGNLFVTVGDRFDLRDQAQNPANHLGKVIHIRPKGGPAPDNPYLNREGTQPEIWSIGHRNVQGAALHPTTGELWTAEHGARGGDEINIPRKGLNYGWPVITYGVDYSGAKIGEGTKKAGMEQPIYYWDPSIAPSGMAFYTGDKFPAWRGSVLVGALAGKLVSRLDVDGDKVTGEERMLQQIGERFRDVRQGPDGYVYLLTDSSNGRILRVRPAD
ncbi:PQQ-dependent sugar dehydrogenase [Microvirga puerhi]|uniref:PQQ-dependent sugar dehydrogenase n=1 Tax=Microvirga puerhi TaxID=2876078 RepID=A0ABS7VRH1_9HYPH|nr:PQQ-dependent sugar dehydrogenase [Microvirga puerhi]MBZ6078148.1 PQQ-dependent sugar dehydrogenase [Microvirga puerhi]